MSPARLEKRKHMGRHKKEYVLRLFKHKCVYCGGTATEVEHIDPYSHSKSHDEQNLVAACVYCNAVASDIVFKSFEDKKDYILERRDKKRRNRIQVSHKEVTLPVEQMIIRPFGYADKHRPAWHRIVYGCGR